MNQKKQDVQQSEPNHGQSGTEQGQSRGPAARWRRESRLLKNARLRKTAWIGLAGLPLAGLLLVSAASGGPLGEPWAAVSRSTQTLLQKVAPRWGAAPGSPARGGQVDPTAARPPSKKGVRVAVALPTPTPVPCPDGQYNSGTGCQVKVGDGPQSCEPNYHWGGLNCLADSPDPQACDAGYAWDGTGCVTTASPTPTPVPTATATPVTRPWNDDFEDAQVLSGNSGTAPGSNLNATKQVGEPIHAQATRKPLP